MTVAARGIYEGLGVRRVINAWGTKPVLGGSRMPPPVVAAMADAARSFVTLREPQERAGEPSIALGAYAGGLLVNPIELDPAEDAIVAERIRAALSTDGS